MKIHLLLETLGLPRINFFFHTTKIAPQNSEYFTRTYRGLLLVELILGLKALFILFIELELFML